MGAPGDLRRMDQLIGAIVNGELDAVSFTSAPAVAATLDRAKALGALDALLVAMRDDVRVMCRAGHQCAVRQTRRSDQLSAALPPRRVGSTDH